MQNTQQNPNTTQDIAATIQTLLQRAHYTNSGIRDSSENVLKVLGQLLPLWSESEISAHKEKVHSILVHINNVFKIIKPNTPDDFASQPESTLKSISEQIKNIKLSETPAKGFWIFMHAISFGILGKEKVAKIEAEQNLAIALKALSEDTEQLDRIMDSKAKNKPQATAYTISVVGIHSKPAGGRYTEKNIFKRIKQAYSS
jgi:hypothetical protein